MSQATRNKIKGLKLSYHNIAGEPCEISVAPIEISAPVELATPTTVADKKKSLVGNNELHPICSGPRGEELISQLVDLQTSETQTREHSLRMNDLLAREVQAGRLDMRILCGVKIARAAGLAVQYNAFRAMYGVTLPDDLAEMSGLTRDEADDRGEKEGVLWRHMNRRTNSFISNARDSMLRRWKLQKDLTPESFDEDTPEKPGNPTGATPPDGSGVTDEETSAPITPEQRLLDWALAGKEIFSLITLEHGAVNITKRWDDAFPRLVAYAEELIEVQNAARAAREYDSKKHDKKKII